MGFGSQNCRHGPPAFSELVSRHPLCWSWPDKIVPKPSRTYAPRPRGCRFEAPVAVHGFMGIGSHFHCTDCNANTAAHMHAPLLQEDACVCVCVCGDKCWISQQVARRSSVARAYKLRSLPRRTTRGSHGSSSSPPCRHRRLAQLSASPSGSATCSAGSAPPSCWYVPLGSRAVTVCRSSLRRAAMRTCR